MRRFRVPIPRLRALLVLAGACVSLSAPAPAAAVSIGGTYAYAGLVGSDVASGVRARLIAASPPVVERGHVAAWVGVGGLDVGPAGEDEWIQVGLASFEGSTTRLYYEVMRGDGYPEYVELDGDVRAGESHRVAVVEMVRSPRHWRVWVDGQPVTAPILLRWSHRAWEPVATAESWSDLESSPTANRFSYRFHGLTFRSSGGGWRAFRAPYVLEDRGFDVIRPSRTSFRALTASGRR